MTPTLLIGDYIFVSKFDFGFVLPFSKVELFRWGAPERGDIIVFRFPRDETLHYVKRVVGVPGDKIQFEGRNLIINGVRVVLEKIRDDIYRGKGMARDEEEVYEERLGGKKHWVKFSKTSTIDSQLTSDVSKTEKTVPPDQYFVVGDSRDDSYDSRSWGFVPRNLLKGKARMIWFSVDSASTWESLDKVRWSRCGTIIQ